MHSKLKKTKVFILLHYLYHLEISIIILLLTGSNITLIMYMFDCRVLFILQHLYCVLAVRKRALREQLEEKKDMGLWNAPNQTV